MEQFPRQEIEDFLYREARLLDERNFDKWLEMFTDDAEYIVVSTKFQDTVSSEGVATHGKREIIIFDDTKASLTLRVQRLKTKYAWAEDPPSNTVRVVSNVLVEPVSNVALVFSDVVIYKAREEADIDVIIATRKDEIVRKKEELKIRRREARLIPPVLNIRNISVFI
ncbi:aromatic-ring-hydroxylating dioxygenase subunit beta [Metallosphaera javensis (ex Sakai et al. 2022)]|uniref:aromatic-ring-hydroxylating dioxygenase subunit beta n=1 Tax=Metallosphaera javensis (ex Sakai et al. 2022) TaxID=2775498 RepID=UPI002582B17D|nr:MAG: hypothetical biphenyl dioxygenase beta subunit [Metallosphaera javensis (ex Sakai et al. 2022)]